MVKTYYLAFGESRWLGIKSFSHYDYWRWHDETNTTANRNDGQLGKMKWSAKHFCQINWFWRNYLNVCNVSVRMLETIFYVHSWFIFSHIHEIVYFLCRSIRRYGLRCSNLLKAQWLLTVGSRLKWKYQYWLESDVPYF